MNGENQPGQIITPGGQGGAAEPQPIAPAPVAPAAAAPVSQPMADPNPAPSPAPPQPSPSPDPNPMPAPSPMEQMAPSPYEESTVQPRVEGEIRWTASEYISHDKSVGWFVLLGLAAVALSITIYFLTKDFISIGAVVIIIGLFAYYAGRAPRTQTYTIDQHGLTIGQRLYPFDELKSFSIIQQGAFSNIVFLPMKRFMPLLPVYYSPEQEDQILDVLGSYLPYEERKQDSIDKLMNKIRF